MNNIRTNISGALSILIVGLIGLLVMPLSAATIHILSIRHGVHNTFDRVVFDLSGKTEYSIDDRQSGRSIYVTIQSADSQEIAPDIEMSPNPKVVADISRMLDGTYQISTLKPVTVKSFTIANSTFRIVVDLYPEDTAATHSSVPAPTLISIEEKKPEVAAKEPSSHDTQEQKSVQIPQPEEPVVNESEPVSKPMDESAPTYDLNSLYNLKQSALRLQANGELDSASTHWEEYLIVAKELQRKLVSIGQSSLNVDGTRGARKSGIYSLIGKAMFLYLPFALFAIVIIFWVVNRYSFIAKIRKLAEKPNIMEEDTEESKEEPAVVKTPKPIASEPIEESEQPEDDEENVSDEEATEEPEGEPVEEAGPPEELKTEEIIEEMPEESTLEELFGVGVDSAAEEEKVKRILELAGEEKSIAEIAEEMGIGEDEVRLVLDLQGYEIPAEDEGKG